MNVILKIVGEIVIIAGCAFAASFAMGGVSDKLSDMDDVMYRNFKKDDDDIHIE